MSCREVPRGYRGFVDGELENGSQFYECFFFSVALLRFFCMPSQADPSQVEDGEALPTLVT